MKKDENIYDVVVVGAGNAALCAAISARENGANVLVLEKGPKHKRGGNSFFTDGAIRFAYKNKEALSEFIPELQGEEGEKIDIPVYDDKDFYNDLMEVTKGKSDPKLASRLVSNSLETIKWMNKNGVEFELNENQFFNNDGKKQFWGGLPVKTNRKGIGLIEKLIDKAESLGIDILYEAYAAKLHNETGGKITGLTVKEKGKTEYTITANSVILACGGFEANKEKRMKHLGNQWEYAVVRGTEYNTGDGIQMAFAVGAQPRGQWEGCHAHTTDYHAPKVGDFNKPGDIYKKSSYPLGLIVNKNGKRFVDEGADFRNYTYAKYGKETLNQPDQLAYQLFDSQVRPLLRKEYDLEEATCIKADTLEELAEKIEINKEEFLKTIKDYNDGVNEGEYNPSIKDGKSTIGVTPPKTNWALRFEQGPFYAYPVTCGITFTFGALHVNEFSEVLNEQGSPIRGLFAAGEMVGGLFYHNYPGGSGLMSGAVFGKIAGESAAFYTRNVTYF
ncbi:FAD-dependent tricarballylate dehydrogenase TcuA [Evansella halocellulosilytica]|uniref:FAD-dependent tricarballylate dehydrogenase TcuA n=1 Tax=Evansella halocellulosilytica TaxID=2011013 RepID=UPI000BB92E44|nr:FAD-dependent tricarballylate dehydrogenase TcuA [Evansella halocellulosilytica]